VQAFHLAIGPNALALGLKAEAALGLFIGADTDVSESSSHGEILLWWSGGYAGVPEVQGKRGREGTLASTRISGVASIARQGGEWFGVGR
jgi:hypothetical protein